MADTPPRLGGDEERARPVLFVQIRGGKGDIFQKIVRIAMGDGSGGGGGRRRGRSSYYGADGTGVIEKTGLSRSVAKAPRWASRSRS